MLRFGPVENYIGIHFTMLIFIQLQIYHGVLSVSPPPEVESYMLCKEGKLPAGDVSLMTI